MLPGYKYKGLCLFFAPQSCSAAAKHAEWKLHPSSNQRGWRTAKKPRLCYFQAFPGRRKSHGALPHGPVLPALEMAEQPSLAHTGEWMALP
ncbi:hypothetical protein V5799_024019 [Amblyomma americanum]|uniref:Uncharacterized protein n=1 Tax=Amblyomma americanum TaxID=6943 RepID=A0AAQ4ED92_AMBAM